MAFHVRAVLVGCGGISGAWLKPIADFKEVELVGFVDLKLEAAEKRRDEFGWTNARVYTDLAQALAELKPDVVFDCTVPPCHLDVVTTALKAGCHVLGEKPMAENVAQAQKMLQAGAVSGRTHAVIQNRRYINEMVAFRQVLAYGEIGELTTLNADFYLGVHFGGFRDAMKHVLLLDMAIHTFDQARFLSGCDPLSVYCHEWNPPGSWYAHGASAMAIFEFSDNVVFNYRGSWCAEGFPTSWECDWRAACTKGSARWLSGKAPEAVKVTGTEGFFRENVPVAVEVPELRYTGHAGVIREFLDCLADNGTPQTAAQDNIKSLAMVEAAVESAETGRKIQIKF